MVHTGIHWTRWTCVLTVCNFQAALLLCGSLAEWLRRLRSCSLGWLSSCVLLPWTASNSTRLTRLTAQVERRGRARLTLAVALSVWSSGSAVGLQLTINARGHVSSWYLSVFMMNVLFNTTVEAKLWFNQNISTVLSCQFTSSAELLNGRLGDYKYYSEVIQWLQQWVCGCPGRKAVWSREMLLPSQPSTCVWPLYVLYLMILVIWDFSQTRLIFYSEKRKACKLCGCIGHFSSNIVKICRNA